MLAAMNFDALSEEDKIDYLLLQNLVAANLHQLAMQKKQVEEMQPLLPFAKTIEYLMESKRLMQRPDAEKDAAALTELVKQITGARAQFDPKPQVTATGDNGQKSTIDPVIANRAVLATAQSSSGLRDWFDQYNGYDPAFHVVATSPTRTPIKH